LNLKRADALKKLIEYKDLIEAAKVDPGKSDPDVLAKLKKLEAEASLIAKELKDIDEKAADLKKKRNDAKKLLDEIKLKP
jgi:peptidoglycan hydrolase CwlO-like protein